MGKGMEYGLASEIVSALVKDSKVFQGLALGRNALPLSSDPARKRMAALFLQVGDALRATPQGDWVEDQQLAEEADAAVGDGTDGTDATDGTGDGVPASVGGVLTPEHVRERLCAVAEALRNGHEELLKVTVMAIEEWAPEVRRDVLAWCEAMLADPEANDDPDGSSYWPPEVAAAIHEAREAEADCAVVDDEAAAAAVDEEARRIEGILTEVLHENQLAEIKRLVEADFEDSDNSLNWCVCNRAKTYVEELIDALGAKPVSEQEGLVGRKAELIEAAVKVGFAEDRRRLFETAVRVRTEAGVPDALAVVQVWNGLPASLDVKAKGKRKKG